MADTKKSLRERLLSTWRPGLLVRLSHLIVVQVVFVFAVVALLIFAPDESIRFSTATSQPHDEFETFADSVSSALSENATDGGQLSPAVEDQLTAIIESTGTVREAILYCSDADGAPVPVLSYRDDTFDGEPTWEAADVAIDADQLASADKPDLVYPFAVTDDVVVYGSAVTFGDGSPGLLVAAWNHDLVVSDRGALGYALLLLFLAAALVALLTVYLIHRHFTRPLSHMVNRFEKTTDGELYYLIENNSEGELSRLANVFNKLSKTIWNDQQQIEQYGSSLQLAQDSLMKSQRLLSTIIEKSPEGIITTSPDGTIMVCNCRAEDIFGYKDGDAIGLSLDSLFAANVTEKTTTGSHDKEKLGLEVIGKRNDGSQFAAYLITSRLVDDNGDCMGYVYIVRDISQSKDYQEMMIRIDRYYTRGEMASEIAHEINNYLSILMGNVELVPLMLKKGNMDRLEAKLELMHQTIEKIARFTDGLLDGTHDEIRFEQADINQLVENVVAFLKPQNRFDYTEVETDLSGDIPLVQVDPGLMQQLLVNLIYNAGDAVFEQEGDKRITIQTYLTGDDKGTLGIKVHDNGPGVQEDKVPLLFKKRFTTKARGHGIGLITCRRILDSHEGDIRYEYSEGALFTVTVPVRQLPEVGDAAGTVEAIAQQSQS